MKRGGSGAADAAATRAAAACTRLRSSPLVASSTITLTPLRFALVIALIAGSALALKGSNAEHRAHLSADLLVHQARHTSARARVIVHGTDAEIDAIAGRHHLRIVRRLAEGAVLAANS